MEKPNFGFFNSIFRTNLQIRTTFGLGRVGGFDEIGCSDFKGNEKSVHSKYHIVSVFHHVVHSF